MFLTFPDKNLMSVFYLLSANALILDQRKKFSFGKELRCIVSDFNVIKVHWLSGFNGQ